MGEVAKAPEPVKEEKKVAASPKAAPKSPAPAKADPPKKDVAEEKKEEKNEKKDGETPEEKAARIREKILGRDLFHRIGGAYAHGVRTGGKQIPIQERMKHAKSALDDAL